MSLLEMPLLAHAEEDAVIDRQHRYVLVFSISKQRARAIGCVIPHPGHLWTRGTSSSDLGPLALVCEAQFSEMVMVLLSSKEVLEKMPHLLAQREGSQQPSPSTTARKLSFISWIPRKPAFIFVTRR